MIRSLYMDKSFKYLEDFLKATNEFKIYRDPHTKIANSQSDLSRVAQSRRSSSFKTLSCLQWRIE
jgi:hypothetical protein